MEQAKGTADMLGAGPTALVNVATALAEKGAKFVPNVLVNAGNTAALDGLAATAIRLLSRNLSPAQPETIEKAADGPGAMNP
jgi:hypothetical protein